MPLIQVLNASPSSTAKKRQLLAELTATYARVAAPKVFAQSGPVSAIAVLGSDPVDEVLAAAMNRHTQYPRRFFTSWHTAEAWHKTHRAEARTVTGAVAGTLEGC